MTAPLPEVGDTVGEFTVVPSTTMLFLFSAATWNPHRIHYDAPFAMDEEGHPGVIVPGPLMGAWMTRLVEEWSPQWRLTGITFRNRAVALAGAPLTVTGTVAATDGSDIVIDVAVSGTGGPVCDGRATATRR